MPSNKGIRAVIRSCPLPNNSIRIKTLFSESPRSTLTLKNSKNSKVTVLCRIIKEIIRSR